MMTERPILFSGEMVRAILAGRKTQTRRVVRPGKLYGEEKKNPDDILNVADFSVHPPSIDSECGWYFDLADNVKILQCPFGVPGDRLWVREAWLNHALPGYPPVYFYRADGKEKPHDRVWKPSIFMPRDASRMQLIVISVRVERVQEITAEDIVKEGFRGVPDRLYHEFGETWDDLNEHRGLGWDVNPWVWVVEFRVLSSRG